MSGWDDLRAEAIDGARLRASPWHGERHWRTVAALGLELAQDDPRLDPAVLLAFGLIHDCRRENEHRDTRHGHRSAEFARANAALLALVGPTRRDTVALACKLHNGSPALPDDADPTIAACLDADRLTLRRVGIEPDPRLLSLRQVRARLDHWLARAAALTDAPPDWLDLFANLDVTRSATDTIPAERPHQRPAGQRPSPFPTTEVAR